METVNKLLEKVCLVTKISFKYFIFKKFCTDKKLELLFLLGHILKPREKIKRPKIFSIKKSLRIFCIKKFWGFYFPRPQQEYLSIFLCEERK